MSDSKNNGLTPTRNSRIPQVFAAAATIALNDASFETVRQNHTHWISSEEVTFKIGADGAEFTSAPHIPWALKDVIFTNKSTQPMALM